MARLNPDNLSRAQELVALYPEKRSALIPILHVLQEQDGYLSEDGMAHVAEIVGLEAVEVRGTASFYDMFHFEPVGKYLIALCTNIACMLQGAYRLLEHAEETLGIAPGGTTPDGMFTLEDAECLALCGNAPCVTVNWRFFGDLDTEGFDKLVDDLRSGRLDGEVPPHGTLSRVRRRHGLTALPPGGPGRDQPALVEAGDHQSARNDQQSGRKGTDDHETAGSRPDAVLVDVAPGSAIDLSTRRSTAATSVVDAAHLESPK